MKGRDLMVCSRHMDNRDDACCGSCRFAMDLNLHRQFCHCGQPAMGYIATASESDVAFYCDRHFDESMLMGGVR